MLSAYDIPHSEQLDTRNSNSPMKKMPSTAGDKFRLTDKDRQLLNLLQLNARESVASLARTLGVSRATVQERIHRLETAQIIQGYSVDINRDKLPRCIEAIVMVLIANKAYKETLVQVEQMETIQSVRSLSGEWDWAIYVSASSLEEFQHTISAVNELDGVKSTVSHIVIDTKLDKRGDITF